MKEKTTNVSMFMKYHALNREAIMAVDNTTSVHKYIICPPAPKKEKERKTSQTSIVNMTKIKRKEQ